MNDTTPAVAALVAERFAAMAPAERVAVAIEMCRTARRIVLSSMPADLPEHGRRRLLCRRLYGDLADLAFPER